MSAASSVRATVAVITAATTPPLLEMSLSRFPDSRAFPLKLPSSSATGAGKVVWKNPLLRCIWQVYRSGVWRTLPRPCVAPKSLPPPSVSWISKHMSTSMIGVTIHCRVGVIRVSMCTGSICAVTGAGSLKMWPFWLRLR